MRFVCADGRKFKKTVDNVKKCGRKSDFWGWERLSDNPHWEREEATEISTFKSNQIKSFLSSSTNAENQPQVQWIDALPAPACRGPVPETQSLLDTRKYLDNRKYFRQWKYLWWTPLFIKQWMDSVRFILKIVSERERKTRACQFLIKATFCQQRHFLWVRDCWCIVNTNPPRPPIGQFRSRDRPAAFSLVSSSKLFPSIEKTQPRNIE